MPLQEFDLILHHPLKRLTDINIEMSVRVALDLTLWRAAGVVQRRFGRGAALAAFGTLVFLLLSVLVWSGRGLIARADGDAPIIPHDRSELPVVPHDVAPRGASPGLRPYLAAIPHDIHEDEIIPHDVWSGGDGEKPSSLFS